MFLSSDAPRLSATGGPDHCSRRVAEEGLTWIRQALAVLPRRRPEQIDNVEGNLDHSLEGDIAQ